MAEKRYKGNKYVYCYCSRHAQVLVGTEGYKYLNIFTVLAGSILTLLVLSSDVGIQHKITLFAVIGLPLIIVPSVNYRIDKMVMLKASHSEECSRKIARMSTYRASLWGAKFKIMNEKDDGTRI
jgi:hypothetical protein